MTKVKTNEFTAQTKNTKLEKVGATSIHWAGFLLVTTVWISAGLFGLYILAFYTSSLYTGNLERWNNILHGLYEKGYVTATAGMGLHFAAGAIILMLGSIQLILTLRVRYPVFYPWIGGIYLLSSMLSATWGLI